MTSYIHIWLNNAITVFGNAIQTNVQRKFAREGTEVWKVENRPFRAFYPSVRTGSSNTRFFTPPSGRGLVIPFFFPCFFFFGGHLPQTSGFRSAKQILVVSFATQARAFILSDRNIFYTPGGGGEQRRGLMPLGLFLFFGSHLPQTFARSKQYLPVIFVRLEFIRQNFHDSWCRKLLAN